MKISGSMNRRFLYYYVPAKFRSLFSFSCSQRAHNLLSTMRQATKLHCCSANRVVLVDGLTHCEVCLSAAAATEGSLGTPSPSRPGEKEKVKEKKRCKTTSCFSCLSIPPSLRQGNSLAEEGDHWSCCPATVSVSWWCVCVCETVNIPSLVDHLC